MKIRLRKLTIADLKLTFQWHNSPELSSQILSYPPPISMEAETQWLTDIINQSNRQRVVFGIESSTEQQLVGIVQLHQIDPAKKEAYLGMFIGATSIRSKGLGSAALNLMIEYAFTDLNLKNLYLEVLESNTGALNFYHKHGFVKTSDQPVTTIKHGLKTSIFILSLSAKLS